jgi:gentisate 1,2-dioxygenase
MVGLAAHQPTQATRSTANAVFVVVEGCGQTQVGEEVFQWSRNDIVTMPGGNWVSHEASSASATLFCVSDRPALERLGLLREEQAASTGSALAR